MLLGEDRGWFRFLPPQWGGRPGPLVNGGASPETWADMLCTPHSDSLGLCPQFLPKNLHLVCVDMPGHEGTTRSSLDDLSIDGQVKRIHQVSREAPPKSCPGGACPPLHPQVWRTVSAGSVVTHNCKQNGSSPVVSSVSCKGPGLIADFSKPIIIVSGEIQPHFLNSSKGV